MAENPAWVDQLQVSVAANVPVLLWGNPGMGKTSVVRSLAESIGAHLEVVLAGLREPADFAGFPEKHEGRLRFAPPDWACRLADASVSGQETWLFLDEINLATPTTQGALMRVVHERTCGDLNVGPDVKMIAAANPPQVSAGGWDLTLPLANRFVHIDCSVNARSWSEGLMTGFPPPLSMRVNPERIAGAEAGVRGLVGSYIMASPYNLEAIPEDHGTRAFPTPRSWENACRIMAAAEAIGASPDIVNALLMGTIGEGQAVSFVSWKDNLDLPDPEKVLADPDAFELPDRGDKRFALASSLVAAYLHNKTGDRYRAFWRAIGRMAEAGHADVCVPAAKIAATNQPPGRNMMTDPIKEIGEFYPLLVRAGLLAGSRTN